MQGLIKTLNLGQAGLKINKSVARATTATSPCWGAAGRWVWRRLCGPLHVGHRSKHP